MAAFGSIVAPMNTLGQSAFRVEEVALSLQRFAATCRIPQHSFRVSTSQDFDLDALVVKLQCAVWARELDKKMLRFPRDWREAIKERFAPRWVLKRWPVRYAFIDVTAYHSYPELELKGTHPILQVVIQEPNEDE